MLDHWLIQTLIQDIIHGNITHEEAMKFFLSEIFTGKTKIFMKNNEGDLYISELESGHSDEQNESKIARQGFAE